MHASASWHWLCIQICFCHLHLCPDLSFNLPIVFVAFGLTSLLFQASSLVTKVKDIRGNPGLPLPALLGKKFSCCVSYCIVEVGDHRVQISIFIFQRSKRCTSTTYNCLESTHHCWINHLREIKPDSCLGWFPWILKACLESHHHHVMAASNICTWECSGSGSFNTWMEPFLHQDVVSLVVMCSIWAVPCPPSGFDFDIWFSTC